MFELPDKDHVVRYCSPSALDNNHIPKAQAFQLRKIRNEVNFSVDWLEFFSNDDTILKKLKSILNVYQERKLLYRNNGMCAILNNNIKLKNEAKKYSFNLKVYQPKETDSHFLIEPSDDLYLAKMLSENIKENYLISNVLKKYK